MTGGSEAGRLINSQKRYMSGAMLTALREHEGTVTNQELPGTRSDSRSIRSGLVRLPYHPTQLTQSRPPLSHSTRDRLMIVHGIDLPEGCSHAHAKP